ncbi:MAG: 3-phosphoshikimate 1-carboxyvinyltransferase [Firmicutes bacterium]|nr:3-phosphoshikimate 1-carboxyvinyltransferase [Bacillota bacterium]
MNIKITPKPLTGKVSVVSSKSLSHRYIIASGLAHGTSVINNVLDSDDLVATKGALSALGTQFEGDKVIGNDLILSQSTIDCKESGSTLRFMIPILLLQKEKVTFTGSGRLPLRSLDVYFDLFKQKNIHYTRPEDAYLPLEVKGPLRAGYYPMRGDVSSQFLTGLLFALPLLNKDSVIEITTPLESRGYINLTLDTLRLFGIHILEVDQYFYIKGGQKYLPIEATVEADYSQAAFWMVAGIIGGKIELSNLDPLTKQGDYKIVDIIKSMVGSIEYDDASRIYSIEPSETFGITIDLSQIPDLGPILMVLASLSKNTTIFTNASRLRIKESDRLDAMYQTLLKFGVDVEMKADSMVVKGTKILKGNQTFDTFGDHRIAMAIAIAAIRADGPVTILNADVVSKSYPKFFEVYQSLGGDIHES